MKYAVQTVQQRNGKWSTLLRGFCPDHVDRRGDPLPSTKFIGYQRSLEGGAIYLTFRCKERGQHTFNNFYPKGAPPPSANYEEYNRWLAQEISKQVARPSRSLT